MPHTNVNQHFCLRIGADAELRICTCMLSAHMARKIRVVLTWQHDSSRAVLWRSNNLADCIKMRLSSHEISSSFDLHLGWVRCLVFHLAVLLKSKEADSISRDPIICSTRSKPRKAICMYQSSHHTHTHGVPIKIILFTSKIVFRLCYLICTCFFASFLSFFSNSQQTCMNYILSVVTTH